MDNEKLHLVMTALCCMLSCNFTGQHSTVISKSYKYGFVCFPRGFFLLEFVPRGFPSEGFFLVGLFFTY